MRHFDCSHVEVITLEKKGEPAIAARSIESSAVTGEPTSRIRLDTAREHEGELRLWLAGRQLSREELRLLGAFTSQGALAIERIRLAHGEKRSRLLEESDQLKSSLLNSVSHELRTPAFRHQSLRLQPAQSDRRLECAGTRTSCWRPLKRKPTISTCWSATCWTCLASNRER